MCVQDIYIHILYILFLNEFELNKKKKIWAWGMEEGLLGMKEVLGLIPNIGKRKEWEERKHVALGWSERVL